jgi:hypothetical protein
MVPEVLQEQATVGDGTVQPPAKVVNPEALIACDAFDVGAVHDPNIRGARYLYYSHLVSSSEDR